MTRAGLAALGIAAALALGAPAARADGAFPDSLQILLPSDKPHEILVGTNFGLLVSEDDGTSWHWVCEDVIAPCARLYSVNAPPNDTVYAVTAMGLVVLTQNACTQNLAQGVFLGDRVSDAFPDPNDPAHVLAIASSPTDSGPSLFGLFESRDRGMTFATQLYQAGSDIILSGVENARTDPQTIYLTSYGDGSGPDVPTVLRSTNGGNTFQPFDQTATLGATRIALVAVDPSNAQKLFLRVTDPATSIDSLALSEDGGMTSTIKQAFPAHYEITAFTQLASGTILVAGLQPGTSSACGAPDFTGNAQVAAFMSTDGGHSFTTWPNAPHARALAERGGVLYAVGNNFTDGFAVASSTDLGAHWTSLLQFDQIVGPLDCLSASCASAWGALMMTFGIGDMGGGMEPQPGGKGCGCALGGAPSAGGLCASLLALLAMTAALIVVRRRARCAR